MSFHGGTTGTATAGRRNSGQSDVHAPRSLRWIDGLRTASPHFRMAARESRDTAEQLANAESDLAAVSAHAEHLQRALVSNRHIGTAMGILMEWYKLTQEQPN